VKKVLIVFDGEHFSKGAVDFAYKMNETSPILLVGIFLPSVDYTDVMLYYIGGMAGPLYIPSLDSDANSIEDNIEKFKAICIKYHIEFRVHDLVNGPIIEAIKKETRYSDVFVLGNELYYSNLGLSSKETYLRDTLHNAECPILLIPENSVFPQSVILAYDGTQTSVYAIKQYAYLFPELTNLSTLIVYASDKKDDMPDLSYIEEFAARHFKDLSFMKLDADPKKYFNTWIMDKGNALLVCGSYGRTSFSEMFKKNFVADIIKEHKLPILIAHM